MISYFAKFPLLGYDIDGSGQKRLAIDILQRIKIRDILKQQWLIYYQYDIKDSDTPEILASKLYGDSGYHWVIMLANDILDPYYDWPMTYDNFIATLRKKYTTPEGDGLIYAYQTIHHYEDLFGAVIDFTNYTELPDAERRKVMVYDWELSENEKKRRIRLIDPTYISQIENEANEVMKKALV